MGARTQGCTSMCTRRATDKPHLCSRENLPQMGGSTSPAICSYIMVFAPCSGVTHLGFDVFDRCSYPRLHFHVHSSLPYISPIPLGRNSGSELDRIWHPHTYSHTYVCVCVFAKQTVLPLCHMIWSRFDIFVPTDMIIRHFL